MTQRFASRWKTRLTRRLEQLDVVADHDEPALVLLEEVAQPDDGVGVEVVGRLVEQQRLGAGEQDAGELDPAALTAGERAERLLEHAVGQAEARGDRGGLGLGGVAALGEEVRLGVAVAAHRLVARRVVGRGHPLLGGAHPAYGLVEAAGGQDAVAREHLEVDVARVLREVADLAAAGDRAGGGLALAGEDPGERRLAGAVAADQADLVAGADAEGRALQQQAGAGTQLDALGGDGHKARILRGRGLDPPTTFSRRDRAVSSRGCCRAARGRM